jgi:ABC-type lipoprotein export system ATPase subunit
MENSIIQIIDLVKIYKLSDDISVRALKGVSVDIKRKEFIAIMGLPDPESQRS